MSSVFILCLGHHICITDARVFQASGRTSPVDVICCQSWLILRYTCGSNLIDETNFNGHCNMSTVFMLALFFFFFLVFFVSGLFIFFHSITEEQCFIVLQVYLHSTLSFLSNLFKFFPRLRAQKC